MSPYGVYDLAANVGWVSAARLLGAAQARRDFLGAPLPPHEQPFQAEQRAALMDALGEPGFAAAWTAGAALTWDQATAEALTAAEGRLER